MSRDARRRYPLAALVAALPLALAAPAANADQLLVGRAAAGEHAINTVSAKTSTVVTRTGSAARLTIKATTAKAGQTANTTDPAGTIGPAPSNPSGKVAPPCRHCALWSDQVVMPAPFNLLTQPLDQWVDVPGTDLTLPQAGTYALDLDARGAIHSLHPHWSNIATRLFDVTAGTEVPQSYLWTVGFANFEGPTPTAYFTGDSAIDNSAHRSVLYTIPGPRTIHIQAYRAEATGRGLNRADAAVLNPITGIRAIKISS